MFWLWSHGVLADKDAPAFIHTPVLGIELWVPRAAGALVLEVAGCLC